MKRFFDFLIVFFSLPLIFPVLVVLATLVWLKVGNPILFSQVRPGLYGKQFRMLKFRTMTDERRPDGQLLPDVIRLTPFGQFLRSASLDELPGLWNVLKGNMSLVGPRPLLMEYLPLYSPEQARRHEVRPGVTGWAQVNGRNAISWEEKFALDVWYVDNQSILLDIKILFLTARKVFVREGISAAGEATMSKFTGTPKAESMTLPLFGVFGASGCGCGIMPLLRAQLQGIASNEQIVFIDDAPPAKVLNDHAVLSWTDFLAKPASKRSVALAIANSVIRESLAQRCQAAGVELLTVQAANVVWMDNIIMGEGALLSPFVTLTSNIRIGRCFHANLYSYVEHDCVIGDFVTFAPSAKCNGNVHIEDHAYIGTGAILKQGKPGAPLVIGRGAIVGMGAVVTKSVPPGVTVVGNPARPLVKS